MTYKNSEGFDAVITKGKKKTADLILAEEKIVCMSTFNFNWRDDKSLAKSYERDDEREIEIRRKHGFGANDDYGFDEIENYYDENDWHRKPQYNGLHSRQVKDAEEKRNSAYRKNLGQGIYANNDDDSKLALRAHLTPGQYFKKTYYMVDRDGNLIELSDAEMEFLNKIGKGPGRATSSNGKYDIENATEEEKAFIEEITKFEKSQRGSVTYLFDNILYMVGTSYKDGESTPFLWLNDNAIDNTFFYINRDELEDLCFNACKKSASEIRKSVAEKCGNNLKKKALYERIMNDVSKVVLKSLR